MTSRRPTRRRWLWASAGVLALAFAALLAMPAPAPPDVVWMRSLGLHLRWNPAHSFTLLPNGEPLSAEYYVVSVRTPPGTLSLGRQQPLWRRLLGRCGLPLPLPAEHWIYDCDLDTTVELEDGLWFRFVRRPASPRGS